MNSYVSSSIYNCLRSGGGVGTCSVLPQAQGLSGLLVRESNCLVLSLNGAVCWTVSLMNIVTS